MSSPENKTMHKKPQKHSKFLISIFRLSSVADQNGPENIKTKDEKTPNTTTTVSAPTDDSCGIYTG